MDHKDKWDKIEGFIWREIQKKWPYFKVDDVYSLYHTLLEGSYIKSDWDPEEMKTNDLVFLLDMYINRHRLSLKPLINVYPCIAQQIAMFEKIGSCLTYDWNLWERTFAWDRRSLISPAIFESTERLNILIEEFGFKKGKYELLSVFYGTKLPKSLIKEAEELVSGKYVELIRDTSTVLGEERVKANGALNNLINNGYYVPCGALFAAIKIG